MGPSLPRFGYLDPPGGQSGAVGSLTDFIQARFLVETASSFPVGWALRSQKEGLGTAFHRILCRLAS